MSAASYGLTLLVKDQGALVSLVNFIAIPLLLLSGITLPLTLAPMTLQNIGHANPCAKLQSNKGKGKTHVCFPLGPQTSIRDKTPTREDPRESAFS